MSEHSEQNSNHVNDRPLFQDMDEQERTYVGEQVPGSGQPSASDDSYSDSPVSPVPPTNFTTPEVTIAAPASTTRSQQAEDVEDNGDNA